MERRRVAEQTMMFMVDCNVSGQCGLDEKQDYEIELIRSKGVCS